MLTLPFSALELAAAHLRVSPLRVLVDLCFSDVLRGPRGAESREDFMAAKKASADALLELNEVMWDSR